MPRLGISFFGIRQIQKLIRLRKPAAPELEVHVEDRQYEKGTYSEHECDSGKDYCGYKIHDHLLSCSLLMAIVLHFHFEIIGDLQVSCRRS
jgi:hypothetical protein